MSRKGYKDFGVDIDKGNKAVSSIKDIAAGTNNEHVLAGIGGFGALFTLGGNYENPVCVVSTDGVGTKLKVAHMAGCYDTVGQDLVAMCVNDILVQGAKPLVFLDYLAMDSLEEDMLEALMEGIAEGCKKAGCSLIGGETAEMPGFYREGLFDMAGFTVGVVEGSQLIDGSQIAEGDVLLGLGSNGVHSNGYSMVRKVLLAEEGGAYHLDTIPPGFSHTLKDELLKPTRIYVEPVLDMREAFTLHGMAHITGGGLLDNIGRVLPDSLGVSISQGQLAKFQMPIFDLIQSTGDISTDEMRRTFNMGVGFVVILPESQGAQAREYLKDKGEKAEIIGRVNEPLAGEGKVTFVD